MVGSDKPLEPWRPHTATDRTGLDGLTLQEADLVDKVVADTHSVSGYVTNWMRECRRRMVLKAPAFLLGMVLCLVVECRETILRQRSQG